MSTSLRDQVILLTASALFMASSPEVAVRPTVYIATTSELYAAVNDSANSGAVVVLAPGSYVLDPSQPNGGRLELQPDMALEGVHGNSEAHDDSEAVVIDASALPATSYQIGPFLTGAIRMGRGVNAIKWLTVQAATNGAAAIETDLPSMIASVRIAHVILQGGQRGIDVRNLGPGQAGRILVAVLEDNLLRDNRLGEGMGIRFVNASGADHATIRATLRSNHSMRNLSGCDAANLNTNEGTILIDSRADRFAANVHGCTLFAGASIGAAASNANDNTLRFVAHGSVFTDNSGPLPANIPWAGGVVALGGANGTGVPRRENRNSLQILRWGTSFGRNQIVDINAFGGVSLNPMVFPGSGNHVDIELHGVSKFATCLVTPSSPADPDGSNTVSIVPMVQRL